jgi:molecular chaperone HscA
VLGATESALAKDAALLEPGERDAIETSMQALRAALAGSDAGAIQHRIEDLDRGSRPFAGRRMDHSIRQALSGQKLADVERETAHAKGIESHLGERRD